MTGRPGLRLTQVLLAVLLPAAATAANVSLQLRFAADQERQDSFGRPAGVPLSHAAQTPAPYLRMGVQFVELVTSPDTPRAAATCSTSVPTPPLAARRPSISSGRWWRATRRRC